MSKKGKAIIVGGSIAGVSCAHSLTLAGWDVLVLEKSSEPPARSPTGAGLGLDPQARQIIKSWLPRPHLLDEITLPLLIDQVVVSLSSVRYSGYCGWRGVFDFSEDKNSETVTGLKKEYPDLGKCLYFDLAEQTHCVFYELINKKLNWIWYVNQPEPDLKSNSVTLKVSQEMINKMHQEANTIWIPELARLMRETKDPFLNVIYDCDPLEQIFWGNVVLVGDAAHPTTPHGLRSTNMSILDAEVLGKCLEKCGPENLILGLEEYQRIRLPVVAEQVLYARQLGRIKQGLYRSDTGFRLEQNNMPFFSGAPLV